MRITSNGLTLGGPLTIRNSLVAPLYDKGGQMFSIKAFGARSDGTGDDGPAINAAIVAAQAARNGTVVLGPGVSRVTTQIVVAGANSGVAIVGIPTTAAMQQGSTGATSAINWAGGASAAIDITTSYTSFSSFSIYNTGSGTSAMRFHPNGRADISRLSFAGPSGASAWSTAALVSEGGLNYSRIAFCDFDVSPAIKLSGVHTILSIESCLFDAIGAAPTIDADDIAGDNIHFVHCTWNANSNSAVFFDNESTTTQLNCLTMHECEFDCASGAFQAYIAKLKNVYNFSFKCNEVSSFSNAAHSAALIQLTAVSRTFVESCNLHSVNPPLIKCLDSDSRVFLNANRINQATTVRILDTTGAVPGNVVSITAGSPVASQARLHGEIVNPQAPTVFAVTATNNSAFSLELPGTGDGTDPGHMQPGTVFTVLIRNTSGGAMGAVTFGTPFKTSGAFTTPATGNSRSITFYYNGTNCVELHRSGADVAN